MKKKVLLLGVMVVLLLTGCGAISKDELLKSAKDLDLDALSNQINENIVAARKEYDGNIYKITAFIEEIYGETTIKIETLCKGDYKDNSWCHGYGKTYVEFVDEDLSKLKKYTEITVVGKLDLSDDSKLTNAYIVEYK